MTADVRDNRTLKVLKTEPGVAGYHGTRADFGDDFDHSAEPAWFATQENKARDYAENDDREGAARVIGKRLAPKKVLDLTESTEYADAMDELTPEQFQKMTGVDLSGLNYPPGEKHFLHQFANDDRVASRLREQGYDAIKMMEDGQETYGVLSPGAFAGGGSPHPYMTPEQNDKFRAVHDYLAHAGGGNQFGPQGEERAYRIHASTLSPRAQRALATETRGQNSWVNYGPNAHLPASQRPFAEQKAALWPETMLGDYREMPQMVELPSDPRKLRTPVIGSEENATRRYARPGGDVTSVLMQRPTQEELRINWMGDTAGADGVGVRGVRELMRAGREEFPSVRWLDNERVSGARHAGRPIGEVSEADAGMRVEFKPQIPDNPADIPIQAELPYYAGTRTPAEKLEEARDLSRKAFSMDGPYGRLVAEGRKAPGAMDWYDTRQLMADAIEGSGDEATGRELMNNLMNAMAGSTAGQNPRSNLKGASLWARLLQDGIVDPDMLRTMKVPLPQGWGSRFQATHQAALARLAETGGLDVIANPKPASFGGASRPNELGMQTVGNLGMNWNNPTLDDVMSQFALEAQPGLAPYITRAVGKDGGVMAGPKGTYYGALARGFRDAAGEALQRGLIDVPTSALAPSAAYQAAGWMGRTGSSELGSLYNVFDNLRSQSADLWGVGADEANRLIWGQRQPLMLPLGAGLLRNP
jgi:hypothetical protein